jgi:hypothetical protein
MTGRFVKTRLTGTIVAVAISIRRERSGYGAVVTPPHGGEQTWTSPTALTRDELIEALRRLGCHTTDIGDAFYAADPDWLTRD